MHLDSSTPRRRRFRAKLLVPLLAVSALACGSSETEPDAKAPVAPTTADGQVLGADQTPPERSLATSPHISVSEDGASLVPAATPAGTASNRAPDRASTPALPPK